jgi:hypothetical protein
MFKAKMKDFSDIDIDPTLEKFITQKYNITERIGKGSYG